MRIQERDSHIRLSATTRSHQAMFMLAFVESWLDGPHTGRHFASLVWYDVDDAVGSTWRRALVKLAFVCYFLLSNKSKH